MLLLVKDLPPVKVLCARKQGTIRYCEHLEGNGDAFLVEPKLVGEVVFTERTSDVWIRHPSLRLP